MPRPGGSLRPQPAFCGRQPDHGGGAAGVDRVVAARHDQSRRAEQVEQELDMVAPRRHRQLMQETLHREGQAVAARRAERAGARGQRQQLCDSCTFSSTGAGNSTGSRPPTPTGDLPSLLKVMKWSCQRRDPALRIQRSLHGMEGAGPVVVEAHVVFARPHELERTLRRAWRAPPPRSCSRRSAGGRSRRRCAAGARPPCPAADPSACATIGRARSTVCTGAHISSMPSRNHAVVFIGSSGACDRNG